MRQGKQAKIMSPTRERAMLGYLATTRYPSRDRVLFLLSMTLLLDSGVFGFPVAQEFSRIFEALEKSGLTGRDRDTNRVIRPRHVHAPGIQ
jgi:hypothetical protein